LSTILEAISLYWLTETFPTSIYPYRQVHHPLPRLEVSTSLNVRDPPIAHGTISAHDNSAWHIHKPLGYSWFPKELAPTPRSWVATTGDLVFFRQHHSGGHFAAVERPEALLRDIEEFVAQVWPEARKA